MKNALKLVGVLLFVLIIVQIDRTALTMHLKQTDLTLLFLAFPLLLIMYVWKAIRWHILVKTIGLHPTVRDSWQIYNIGTFLGMITPAKIGELGRAAYLKRAGLSHTRSLGIVILDRAADIVVISLIAIAALGVLFGTQWSGTGILIMLFFGVIAYRFLPRFQILPSRTILFVLFLWTLLGWATYFLWAILVAYAVGITMDVVILISILTITGVVALLPIAPSGLGTRDAALITLLAPFGVPPEQAVTLAFLMFISIVASSGIGGYYWIRR